MDMINILSNSFEIVGRHLRGVIDNRITPEFTLVNEDVRLLSITKYQVSYSCLNNPAKDYIVVEYNAEGLGESLELRITDIDGKVVKTEKLTNKRDSKNIDIKRLKSGSYILNICSEGNVVYSKKFLVK